MLACLVVECAASIHWGVEFTLNKDKNFLGKSLGKFYSKGREKFFVLDEILSLMTS